MVGYRSHGVMPPWPGTCHSGQRWSDDSALPPTNRNKKTPPRLHAAAPAQSRGGRAAPNLRYAAFAVSTARVCDSNCTAEAVLEIGM